MPVMNTNLSGDIGAKHPPIDAIGQFKIINNNRSAQYGLASGIVSFAFNSGTNDYHGSLFDYLQNDALNAAGFVANALGLKKEPGKFGNAPNLFSSLRMPAYINEDLSITKRTTIYGRANLLFQANFFNALNRPIFSFGGNAQTFIINNAPPDLSTGSLEHSNTVFGLMTAQQNAPIIIQFGMRPEF